jgi:hypothetical protein
MPRRIHESPILQQGLDAAAPEKEEQSREHGEGNRTHPPVLVIIFPQGTLRKACLSPEGLGKGSPQRHE